MIFINLIFFYPVVQIFIIYFLHSLTEVEVQLDFSLVATHYIHQILAYAATFPAATSALAGTFLAATST